MKEEKLGLFPHYINHVNNLGVPGKLIQNLHKRHALDANADVSQNLL